MDTLKSRGIAVLKFIGISLLIDLGLLAAVGLSCVIGTRCTRIMWSERMFWVGMIPLMVGLAGMISWLGSGPRPFAIKPSEEDEDEEEEGEREQPVAGRPEVRSYADQEAWDPDAESEDSKGLSSRAQFALRMFSVGAGAYLLSALLDVLTR